MRLKYEKVIHRAMVNNLFRQEYTKKSCNAQGSSKYCLFVTASFKQKGPGSLLLSRLHTIVAVMMLNFRVRDGNGCVHHAIAARSSRDPSKPDTSSSTNVYSFQSWPSPRPISTAPLSTSLRLHSRPINLVVFEGPYLSPMGGLILEGASRLDAFSAYPVRTWLPSCATGVTTGAPSVRPPRSSRTRGSSPQTSCAHDR